MKLLDKVLEKVANIFAIIERLDVIGKLIILVLLVLSMYYLKNCGGQELEKMKVEVQQTKQEANDLKDSVVALTDTVNTKEVMITKLTFEVSLKEKSRLNLVNRQKYLESRRIVETDTVTIVALQDSTIDNLKGQIAIADTIIIGKDSVISEREKQVNLLRTAVQVQDSRANLLESQLDKVMKQREKETKILGFIPKPTRKAAFIVGATAGVITGIVIAK
jgi:hypothetical protein